MPATRKTTATTTKKTAGKKPGLYANIQAKHERIAHGSGEHMRAPGAKGAPAAEAFVKAAQTSAAAKKAPAKRAASKEAAAKEAAAKKAVAKKAVAKKAAVKKREARKAVAKKATPTTR